MTVSGATVTAPAGYYASSASKSVATGTAGTPTATKGTVSNYAVSVTPSVTNTTGYITGSTKTGTAVTVSASELVSGTKSITENGTGIDVTNYASVDVDVPTGSSATLITKSITANGTYNASSDFADGYSSVTVNVSGGGGGLEYEAGTWTPTSATGRPTIYFSNTHTVPPAIIKFLDAGDSWPGTAQTNVTFVFTDWYRLNGYGIHTSETATTYATVNTIYHGSNASSIANGVAHATSANSDSTSDTSTTCSRYYAKPDCFMPYSGSSTRYWQTTRTYKWIAIWVPTT